MLTPLEYPPLDKDYWVEIAQVWNRCAHQPIHDPESTLDLVLIHLKDKLRCHHVGYVLARRSFPDEKEATQGWRPIQVVNFTSNERQMMFMDAWAKDVSNLTQDLPTIKLIERHGEHRTMIRTDIMGQMRWQDAYCWVLFEVLGITDRLTSGLPVDEQLELYLLLDRNNETPEFNHEEKSYVHHLCQGLLPYIHRLGFSYGYLKDQKALTPRERQSLLFMMEGFSEKEIASQMGVTPQTIHQYIMSVYRKCNVNSRARLMARWLEQTQHPVHLAI